MNFLTNLNGMRENVVKEKSFDFAIKVVAISKEIATRNREWDLTRQMKRSGTAIGALIRESEHAESKKDFIHKLSISMKEANETEYWVDLLYRIGYMTEEQFQSIRGDISELNRLLIAILKTLKGN